MAEVAFVVGLVASVIGIIDGVKTVWDALKDPKGQPEAFRQVAARLPLILSILDQAKSEAKKLDEAAQQDLEKVLESCKEKAEKLNKIFKKVLPGDEDGRLDRYRKAVSAPFKGGRVEELMEGILRDAQSIATDKLLGIATEEQVKDLADAIKEMKEMPSSFPEETGTISQTHSGSGNNIANTGPGSTNIQLGENSQDQQKWNPKQGNIHWVISRIHNGTSRFWSVFWINASASSTIQRGYLDAAQRCQPDGSLETKDFKIAKSFFDNVKHPYLFVLNNADDVKETLHPKSRYGTVGAKILEKLDLKDAIELLFKASNTPEIYRVETQRDAKAVVQLLAQHALAVQQKRPSLLCFRNTEDFSRYGDVYATFEVSAQFLEESKSTSQAYANALELLGVLGHLYFTRVPLAMFTYAWKYAQNTPKKPLHANDISCLSPWHVSKLPKPLQVPPLNDGLDDLPDSLHDSLGVLRSFAIITIQLETKEISMHPLAHAWAQDRLSEADKQGAWACTMSLIALSTFQAIKTPPQYTIPEVLWAKHEYARALSMDGKQKEAIALLQDVVKNSTMIPEDPGRLESQHRLAIALSRDDRHKEAISLLRGVFQELNSILKPEHTSRLASQHELAVALSRDGNHEEAIFLLRDVVQIQSTIGNPTHANYLTSQHELAIALTRDGKHKEAIYLLRDVVRIQSTISNPAHPNRLASQQALAWALSRDGNYKEALKLIQAVVIIVERQRDPSDERRRYCELLLEECIANKEEGATGSAVKIREIQIEENRGNVREGEVGKMKMWGKEMWEKNMFRPNHQPGQLANQYSWWLGWNKYDKVEVGEGDDEEGEDEGK
ncbi:hypothetical protein V502_09728 [Pseudogymnoascus sp. VKM F-4520 (FW-2644)]|nr:hypothetical protein V502_09728 [Pseudogymnoascus sp. VKM F-4520 (FW-2644)]